MQGRPLRRGPESSHTRTRKAGVGMSQTLASDMIRKSLDVFLETVERSHDFPADEVRELLDSCEIPALVLEGLWELTQGFLDRGMEGKRLAFLLKEFVDVFKL